MQQQTKKTPLDILNEIPGYGKRTFMGGHFRVKFRCAKTSEAFKALNELRKRYPEMAIHFTKDEKIIFGGTFSSQSQFLFDVQRLTGIKAKM